MSIQVEEFQWIPGENDAEYIRLLKRSNEEAHRIMLKATGKLVKMQEELRQARLDRLRGFPITQDELESIYAWIKKHDTEVHNNPRQYHGASGGGYEYVFYPTGLGVAADCICVSCKCRSIKENGEKWYVRCKELGGVFEFQQLG